LAAALAALCIGVAACGSRGARPPAGATPAGQEAATPSGNETGAVQSVPGEDARGARTIEELLEGRVAGLQVIRLANGDVSLRIRGTNSLMEEGDPLVIIDGMTVTPGNLTRALRSLRPQEIEDIKVLKDVSSTSMYGMAGAHGVILITTKRER